jgi:NAD(P)-dependent dehydrogenase (short-subunit alcohol dehydrogenase family)
MSWTDANVPDLTDKTVVLTGANSGIGFEAAWMLPAKGAHVVMACRNEDKANAAMGMLRERVQRRGSFSFLPLDLADLASVRAFTNAYTERFDRLDVLVNNAGIMAIPRRLTKDGFEMQLGTNHLGHFALTSRLMPTLLATEKSRIVHVSSLAHRVGTMDFVDLMGERNYARWPRYGQSKLANLLFHFELQRRLGDRGPISVACHPGYAATNLQFVAPQMDNSSLAEWGLMLLNAFFAQTASRGALPTAYAATALDVRGGDYIGPSGFREFWGTPTKVAAAPKARDAHSAKRLWEASVTLTGEDFGSLA